MGTQLGRRIRAWRVKARLSVKELAEAVGVDDSAVYHWESGRAAPRSENLGLVATACGIGLSEFYGPLPRKAA